MAGQKQIVLYNSETAELFGVLPFPEGAPHVLRFSRSGSLLLAGGGRGGQSGRVVCSTCGRASAYYRDWRRTRTVLAADINEDHRRVALGGPRRVVANLRHCRWHIVHEIRKHTEWVTAIEFSPDGVLLATADRNGGMFVWEAETAREYQNLKGHTAAISGVSWRIDGNLLASASEDGTLKLWEMEGGQQVKNWNAHGGGSAAVNFAMDGRLVSCGRDKTAKVWDQNGQQQRAFDAFGDIALRTTFTHDGGRVAAGDWTGEVRLWNAADGRWWADWPAIRRRWPWSPRPKRHAPKRHKRRPRRRAASSRHAQKEAADKGATAAALAERLKNLQAELEKATADKAATDKLLAEKAAAAKAAADAAAAAASAAAKAADEKAAFDKTQTAQARRRQSAPAGPFLNASSCASGARACHRFAIAREGVPPQMLPRTYSRGRTAPVKPE